MLADLGESVLIPTAVMTVKFIWKPEYETGNPRIDKQHKQLFELANLLWVSVERDRAEAVATAAIEALTAYAAYHFSDEEEFFERIKTPMLEDHRQQHEALAAEIRELAVEDLVGTKGIGARLEHWVEGRLVPHMMHSDQDAIRAGSPED